MTSATLFELAKALGLAIDDASSATDDFDRAAAIEALVSVQSRLNRLAERLLRDEMQDSLALEQAGEALQAARDARPATATPPDAKEPF